MLTVARYATGEHVDISTLAKQKEQHEPRRPCFCLSCGRRLMAKLGRLRAHHFGHHPHPGSDRCWATSPEGAIHINAKALLKRLLESACAEGRALSVARSCPRCRQGEPVLTEVVRLDPADTVLVEAWADPRKSLRPDLQVLGPAGKPRLVVEVLVTHSSSDEKLRWALSLAVPLLEIQGAAALLMKESSSTLVCSTAVNVPSRPRCVACEEAAHVRSTPAQMEPSQVEKSQMRAAEAALARSAKLAQSRGGPPDKAKIAALADARAKTLDAEERRRKELLPEAKARATARILLTKRTLQVAEFTCTAQPLRVHASWLGGTVTLDLVTHSGQSIRSWTGTQKEMERAFGTELVVAARNYLERSHKPSRTPARLVVCNGVQVDTVTGIPNLEPPAPEMDPRWVKIMLEELRRSTSVGPGAPPGPSGSRDR